MKQSDNCVIKPVLKWAGGKSQMLDDIIPRMPKQYNAYIEPFIGSGALFFALAPKGAIIADSNSELINLYMVIANEPERFIEKLDSFENTKDNFYQVRSLDWKKLTPIDAAARMVFLNKTCFNGLYRVNKKGQFNTPYANNKRTTYCDVDNIMQASALLKQTRILCGDYHDILLEHAKKDDFIFLDPPYIPISKYSDFKRYTKDQFGEDDQRRLAEDVFSLYKKGCKVMMTNSNHPLIYELYKDFNIEVFQTKRMINKNGNNRTGEDVIVRTY